MATQVSYPGVYIEEFTAGAPIQGVATNIAAFLGGAAQGPSLGPTKLTSWDGFVATFGAEPLPGFYLWHAVRGFFQNGGQVCYVVRASNGDYDKGDVVDRAGPAGSKIATLRARAPGKNKGITVTFSDSAAVSAPRYAPTGQYKVTGTQSVEITGANLAAAAASAAQFRPGDWIRLNAPDTLVQIASVGGPTLRTTAPLGSPLNANGEVRLADLAAGAATLRIAPASPLAPGVLVPGTMLTVTQGSAHDTQIVDSVQTEQLATLPKAITTYRITFRRGLAIPLDLSQAASVAWDQIDVKIVQGTQTLVLSNLSSDPSHPRYFIDAINAAPSPVQITSVEPLPVTPMPTNLPATGPINLKDGADEDLTNLGDAEYLDALDTLRDVDDVNLVAVPAVTTPTVQQAVIAHCQQLADRFAVLDAAPSLPPFAIGADHGVDSQRAGLDSAGGYAALYYPWLRVPPPRNGAPILVPPSGHVCGIIARSHG
jgi:hypothetical protein